MPHVTTDDGTELHYAFESPESGQPTLVFLNGMTQSTEHWKTQVAHFRDEAGVLTYDARGQGQSELGGRDLSMPIHVSDLETLLDHLDQEHVHLLGFSHGSRIALGFTARHPSRVAKLLLCSLTAEPDARARTIIRSWREVLEAGGLEAMTWAALSDILGPEYLESHESIIDGIVEASLRRNSVEGARALMKGLETYPPNRDVAADIEVPTLVVSGEHDPLVDAEGAQQLAELTGGRHRHVEGAGHTIPIEKPNVFRDAVAEFIGL